MNEIKNICLLVYPVKDTQVVKALYTKLLGVEPYTDEAHYVGFNVGDLEVGLDANSHQQGITTPIAYIEVTELDSSLRMLLENGGTVHTQIQDVGEGYLAATVKDINGNILGLMQAPKR